MSRATRIADRRSDRGKYRKIGGTTPPQQGWINHTPLYNWNDPADDGLNWSGHTYFPPGGPGEGADQFGSAGWRKDDGSFLSGDSNWQPRNHEKKDYGQSCLPNITALARAPSTQTGKGLHVYDDGTGSASQASWWFIQPSSYGEQGLATSVTNRLSFYMYCHNIYNEIGPGSEPPNFNMHFGTYLCWEGASGGDCPNEAPGRQHYYHHLSVRNDGWIHVLLDAHPQHRAGESPHPPLEPALATYGKYYFENMNTFYHEIRRNAFPDLTFYYIDEVELWQTAQSENDESICSLWVGYFPSDNRWEIGWNDGSYPSPGSSTGSTFDIRWSESLITNANFHLATQINAEYNLASGTNFVKRPNNYKWVAWTRFELPSAVQASGNRLYFAVKDVSIAGGHDGDGHDAPSDDIHLIDYVMP